MFTFVVWYRSKQQLNVKIREDIYWLSYYIFHHYWRNLNRDLTFLKVIIIIHYQKIGSA